MAKRDEAAGTAISGYRRVSRDELHTIVREVEGMPVGAAETIARAVW